VQRKTQSLTRRQFITGLAGAIVVVIVLAGFLMVPLTPTINAAPESKPPLDCLSCHPKKLEFHDKLGSGNKACWVCHDSTDMTKLHSIDGTPLSLSDSPQLCAQCHQKRYDAWKEGTHGISGTVAEVKCTSCHNPHQPQIALLDITKSHPAPTPPPPPPPVKPLIVLGIFLLLLPVIALFVVGSRRGEGP